MHFEARLDRILHIGSAGLWPSTSSAGDGYSGATWCEVPPIIELLEWWSRLR